jgi:uncharacterized protein
MEIAGYFASVLIGISLGLIGGGGSVLTVPVLYYLFGLAPLAATTWSLFIVGATSAVGSVTCFRKKEVHLKAAFLFGVPSIAAVFATRAWLLPAIPEQVFSIGETVITRGLLLLLLFAALMIAASYGMIRKSRLLVKDAQPFRINYPLILAEGLIVGTLTGLVGAGGGFLIIPALVLISGLPMKQAVGTSLVIIAMKSLIGFLADADTISADWSQLLLITACAIVGVFIGSWLSRRVNGETLKPVFGWFILIMGLYIIISEVLQLS